MKFKLPLVVVTLLTGLMLNSFAMAADAESYESAVVKAREMIADAESRAQLWTTTDDLLESAGKAAASGDFDRAIELVNEATLHVELAVATAEREKDKWQKGVPR